MRPQRPQKAPQRCLTTMTTCKVTGPYDVLEALGGAHTFDRFMLPVEPAPASRPKVSRFGVHYSKKHTEFVRRATPYAEAYTGTYIGTGSVAVVLEFVSTKAKTSKLLSPNYDIDNAAKLPLDVMTASGNFWKDDKQVTQLYAVKRFAASDEQPGVNIYYKQL